MLILVQNAGTSSVKVEVGLYKNSKTIIIIIGIGAGIAIIGLIVYLVRRNLL